MNNKCLIVLSYVENYDIDYVNRLANAADYIIAADGGQDILSECGITPDLVIGDFDSTINEEYRIFDCEYIKYPCEKDLTDTEACVLKAIEAGYNNITVLGGIGGRLDHTFGNAGILSEFHNQVERLVFCDMKNAMFLLINSSVDIYPDGYKYFALISLDESAKGINITGAKYPLKDYTLIRGTTLGISNEVADEYATVTVKDGALLIIRSSDFR